MTSAKRYYWLKLKTDFFNTREVKKLRKVAGGDTYTIIYLKMQLLSIKGGGVIKYEGTEEHFDEQLALELDEEIENIRMTLAFLHQNMMIEPLSNDEYLLNQVPELIGSETTAAERMRKYRNGECNIVTPLLQPVTKSYTEIEIEKELDIELEKEKDKSKNKRFSPPSHDQVKEYCLERKNGVDAQRFIDFYESKGWMVGKNKMKDWKAAVRNWEQRNNNNGRGGEVAKSTDWNDRFGIKIDDICGSSE